MIMDRNSVKKVNLPFGRIIAGDPMFGRNSKLIYCLNNTYAGYWYVMLDLSAVAGKKTIRRLILKHDKHGPDTYLELKDEIEIPIVSGYIGLFDEKHYQAGNERCCPSWIRYCHRSIRTPYDIGIITCGLIVLVNELTNKCKCKGYIDKFGQICMCELLFH